MLIVTLLNVSLIIMPVQMTLASTVKNAHDHGMENKQVKPCKHAKSPTHSTHSINGHDKATTISAQHIHKADMTSFEKILDVKAADVKELGVKDQEQHTCQCSNLCADCCGGHAVVALPEFEFQYFAKPESSQPVKKIYHYKQISLPIENPPPVA